MTGSTFEPDEDDSELIISPDADPEMAAAMTQAFRYLKSGEDLDAGNARYRLEHGEDLAMVRLLRKRGGVK